MFTATPAAVGLAGPRPTVMLRCDSLPNKFGAAAAAMVEAAVRDSLAKAGAPAAATPRGGAPTGIRDTRALRAGAVGILFVALDSAPRSLVNAAFNSRMTMQPAATLSPPAGAAVLMSDSFDTESHRSLTSHPCGPRRPGGSRNR